MRSVSTLPCEPSMLARVLVLSMGRPPSRMLACDFGALNGHKNQGETAELANTRAGTACPKLSSTLHSLSSVINCKSYPNHCVAVL